MNDKKEHTVTFNRLGCVCGMECERTVEMNVKDNGKVYIHIWDKDGEIVGNAVVNLDDIAGIVKEHYFMI